ncbi:MAG: hypothetical protein SGJ19_21930 [Planctomycetia bacterium]|nr:hypothetical protein [Planctomycetia bacterium]
MKFRLRRSNWTIAHRWQRALGAAVAPTVALALTATAAGSGISGTMSNFDVFNETETEAHGAELELEDVHSVDVMNTYPSHFDFKTIEEYNEGGRFGTRIRFTGYNFSATGSLAPSVGQNTNGHLCVNVPGCEHFGFAVSAQPTATRYYWLDSNQQRIGVTPMSVPNPSWTYFPPANPGDAPMLRAEVEMPEPAEVHEQRPDSIWMKVYKTELDRAVGLDELMSAGDIVPEDEAETESEWELLEGGKMKGVDAEVGEHGKAVIRRYEYFRYTGPYDEEHEPLSIFLDQDMDEPPAGELGDFIAANMVAANLVDFVDPVAGDTNQDGVVNIVDLNNVRNNFGGAGLGDANGDDLVNIEDLNAVRNNFGAGDVQPVPEPMTLALCVIGIISYVCVRTLRTT